MNHTSDAKSVPFSPVALGTWSFAGDTIWAESDEKESIAVIHAALDRGIALFDTSPNYGSGRSEMILGKALKGRSRGSVATKIKVDGLSETEITRAVEQSLRNLRRESIDLMQIHWPAAPSEVFNALNCFMDLKAQGKIKNIGVCNFGIFDLEETKSFPIISNQLPFNLLWRVVEEKIAPASKSMGMKVWAYSPFQQGLLTGRYKKISDFPEGRMRTRIFSSERKAAGHGEAGMEPEAQNVLDTFLNIAEQTGISPLELGLRYIESQSFIDTILVGARTVDQLMEIINSMKGPLDYELSAELNRFSEALLKATKGNPDMYQHLSRVRYKPV